MLTPKEINTRGIQYPPYNFLEFCRLEYAHLYPDSSRPRDLSGSLGYLNQEPGIALQFPIPSSRYIPKFDYLLQHVPSPMGEPCWTTIVLEPTDKNIELRIYPNRSAFWQTDGTAQIGDEFHLYSPEEIKEIARWYTQGLEPKEYDFREYNGSDLISGVFFLVENNSDQTKQLVSRLESNSEGIKNISGSAFFNSFLQDTPKAVSCDQLKGVPHDSDLHISLSGFCDRPVTDYAFAGEWHNTVGSGPCIRFWDGHTELLRKHDLILGCDGDMCTPQTLSLLSETSLGSAKIMFRPNYKQFSFSFLQTFFRFTNEGKNLRAAILENLKDWRSAIADFKFILPSPKHQIGFSQEFRIARHRIISGINDDYTPIQHANKIMWARADALDGIIFNDRIQELEWLTCNLPYWIAYPYYHWQRTSDLRVRKNLSLQLLDLMCKTLVFLPLEEFRFNGVPMEEIPERLRPLCMKMRDAHTEILDGKPLSNGRHLALVKDWSSVAPAPELDPFEKSGARFSMAAPSDHETSAALPYFSASFFLSFSKLEPLLQKLLSARNRMTHPPFDESTFHEICAKTFPDLISKLRKAFRSLSVLAPQSTTYRGKRFIMKSFLISGFDGRFANCEFEVESPDRYPCDQLVLRSGSDATVCLGPFFTLKESPGGLWDVGIVDRFRDGKPVYTFVREMA